MQLDQVTTEIRARKPWEAVDLGFLMARRWWWPMTKAWLLVTLPVFVLLQLLLSDYIWVVAVALWWLKPLFERIHLHILSQSLFGHLPGTRETLRVLPKILWPQSIAALTWRRFSPSRSMDLAVTQLEGLSGKRRKERLAVLHRQEDGPAGWLTLIGVHVESFLSLGAYGVLYALIPSEIEFDFMLLLDESAFWSTLLQNLLAYLAIGLVAPFYVGGGFALYINRRVRLEAWDIDIAFRRLVDRQHKRRAGGVAAVGLAMLMLLGSPLITPPVEAAETANTQTSTQLDPDSARLSIEAVMAGDDFHDKQTVRLPDISHWFEGDESASDADWSWLKTLLTPFKWLAQWVPQIAGSLEFVLWILVLALILVLVFRYRDWLVQFVPSRHPGIDLTPSRPLELFGMDMRPEQLPEDIPAAVMTLWQQGEQRAALSLLYRAALVELINRHQLPISAEHTERECLQMAELSLTKPTCDYVEALTQAWQGLAYGHLPLSEQGIEGLCLDWPQHFPSRETG